jgi:phenylpropionate dioxygenase-like ring-hydroxylating dioxygenase large terminal subunit
MLGFIEKIPFYYQIPYPILNIQKMTLFDEPYLLYKDNNQSINNRSINILSDICPHQGASLSKGWINKKGNIHCPYHGFEFDKEGYFCGIPNPNLSGYKSKWRPLPSYLSFSFMNDIFICPINNTIPYNLPFYPPEHFNTGFGMIKGSQTIKKNFKIVTENVLDMLHISYIHSFGNLEHPLPLNIKYEKLNEFSGKSIFTYRPFKYTISNQIGKTSSVIVENEFHLPTTTITRVIAGDIIKTVMTRSVPIDENTTIMFWYVYRNFWFHKNNHIINYIGDLVLKFLMKFTLSEDINILKNVYPEGRNGTVKTKYDVTILKYRDTFQKYLI